MTPNCEIVRPVCSRVYFHPGLIVPGNGVVTVLDKIESDVAKGQIVVLTCLESGCRSRRNRVRGGESPRGTQKLAACSFKRYVHPHILDGFVRDILNSPIYVHHLALKCRGNREIEKNQLSSRRSLAIDGGCFTPRCLPSWRRRLVLRRALCNLIVLGLDDPDGGEEAKASNGLDLDHISTEEIIFSSPLAAFLACSRRLSASSSFCLQPTPNRYKRERQAIAKGKPEAAAFLLHSNAFFRSGLTRDPILPSYS